MPNKRKICTENINSNQSIYIASLNSYYQPESVLNSAYRKVLDFKENAEKILEKEKSETLNLNEFSKAILDSRSFEISLQHNCIKLKCYITLEKDKDSKKKRNEQQQQQQQQQGQSPPGTPGSAMSYGGGSHMRHESTSSCYAAASNDAYFDLGGPSSASVAKQQGGGGGGAKKVNVEVIMKSNPFRVEENEKTTRMELIKNTDNSASGGGNMLRFTYYVRPECEKFRETNSELYEKGRLVVFTNDFFTVYQDAATGEMNISLNEIVQSPEEQKRTEALGEKLFVLLKDRPRHRALLTNECKLNHSMSMQSMASLYMNEQISSSMNSNMSMSLGHYQQQQQQQSMMMMNALTSQEDETYYTRELIQIYGQPIVPSFHKHFNYQLSNTHYGYRTLRRLLNCDILKKYVKITKEEIKSLDRVVEFVQLTSEKCLNAFQLNITSFYDPARFENGIVKNWLDVWYVDRLKEKYSTNNEFQQLQQQQQQSSSSATSPPSLSQQSSPQQQHQQSPLLTSSLSSPSNLSAAAAATHTSPSTSTSWSVSLSDQSLLANNNNSGNGHCFLHTTNCGVAESEHGVLTDMSQVVPSQSSECDQANHLWFCLRDYACTRMSEFLSSLKDYIQIRNNRSELILVHTAHPLFEYKDVLSETRRVLTLFLNKSTINKTMDEIVSRHLPGVAREHIEHLLGKFLIIDAEKKVVVGFTALFEILMILKRELSKEKNDEMKYSHFLCTLERANQEKLKMAIVQLKCVPCLNKFTTNFSLQQQQQSCTSPTSLQSSPPSSSQSPLSSSQLNKPGGGSMVSHANMSRLLKQMSLIVSTELQQIAIDVFERLDEDKAIKYIKLKEEFRQHTSSCLMSQHQQQQQQQQQPTSSSNVSSQYKSPTGSKAITGSGCGASSTAKLSTDANQTQLVSKQHQQINNIIQMTNLTANFKKVVDLSSPSSSINNKPSNGAAKLPVIFNPKKDLEQFMSHEQKQQQDMSAFRSSASSQHHLIYSEKF